MIKKLFFATFCALIFSLSIFCENSSALDFSDDSGIFNNYLLAQGSNITNMSGSGDKVAITWDSNSCSGGYGEKGWGDNIGTCTSTYNVNGEFCVCADAQKWSPCGSHNYSSTQCGTTPSFSYHEYGTEGEPNDYLVKKVAIKAQTSSTYFDYDDNGNYVNRCGLTRSHTSYTCAHYVISALKNNGADNALSLSKAIEIANGISYSQDTLDQYSLFITEEISGSYVQQMVFLRKNSTVDITFIGETTVSVNGTTNPTTYVIPKETSSATVAVNFTHTIKGSSPNCSTYSVCDVARYNQTYSTMITDNSDNSTKTFSSTSSTVTVNLELGESKTICQTGTYSPETIRYNTGTKTYTIKDSDGSSSACVTIIREGEANYGLKSTLTISGAYSGNGSITAYSPTTYSNKWSNEYSSVTSQKVFADSSKNDNKINLAFSHTIYRDTSLLYDPNKSLPVSWGYKSNLEEKEVSITSTLGHSGTTSSTIGKSYQITNNSSLYSIPLGTYSKQICQEGKATAKTTVSTSTTNSGTLSTTVCADLYRPYNFSFNVKNVTETTEDEIQYRGAQVKAKVSIENKENENSAQEGTHSYSPQNTKARTVVFVVSREATAENVEDKLTGAHSYSGDVCAYFRERLGSLMKYFNGTDCTNADLSIDGATVNSDKSVTFADGVPLNSTTGEATFVVPTDLSDGDKVCFATAVQYADSTVNNTGYGNGYGTMDAARWTISDASCRSTAKKPSFQVWGGSVYATGAISASLVKIYDTTGTSATLFGSWVDYGVISGKGEITYVSSGAGLAEGDTSGSYNCKNSPLSLANTECSSQKVGESGVVASSINVDRIISRYANNNLAYTTKHLPSGGSYDLSNSSNYVDFMNRDFTITGEASSSSSDVTTSYRYTYINGSATITASTPLDPGATHVIYATGSITIGSNLTYNNSVYNNAASIPQYIIIADGGISISNNATRVDAWLVTPNAPLNTCDQKYVGGTDDESVSLKNNVCANNLDINGPVFAKYILLNRTGSENYYESPSAYAEKFDINAASFLWGYTQAHDYSQAVTTYVKELPPRY